MEFSVKVDEEGTHTRISCEGKTFDEVRGGLKQAISELQRTLDEQKKCPMFIADNNDLHVKISNGNYAILKNGKIDVTISQAYRGYEFIGRDKFPVEHNKPCFNTVVEYVLTFENEIQDPWMDNNFQLEIMGKKFKIDSYIYGALSKEPLVRAICTEYF
jgi:hypothetical protein